MYLTMNEITAIHVVSEPGDATRYDYLVYRDGDEYSFAPVRSSFKFPAKLNYWHIKDLGGTPGDDLAELAKEHDCNPHTLKECIRYILCERNPCPELIAGTDAILKELEENDDGDE